MAKTRTVIDINKEPHIIYNCPGCGYEHSFSPKIHTYNNNREKPTVSPSLLLNNPQNYHTCHSFIKDGFIQFLGDCWHELKGKTVELPDYPAGQELDTDYTE